MRDKLSEYGGMVVRGSCIVIPGMLRADIFDRIHDGHQGLSKCRDRANATVWWPGISSQLVRSGVETSTGEGAPTTHKVTVMRRGRCRPQSEY